MGIPFKPEEINWDDEKFKKQYQLYFDVDIKKNVMSNAQNVITDIKIKKKKNTNGNVSGNIHINLGKNINDINDNKIEEENEKSKDDKEIIDKNGNINEIKKNKNENMEIENP